MESRADLRKLLLAAAVSPLAILPGSMVLVLVQKAISKSSNTDWGDYFLVFNLVGIPIAYVAMLAFGLPLAYLLKRIGLLNLITVTVGALVGALIVTWVLFSEVSIAHWPLVYLAMVVAISGWLVYAHG